MSASTYNISIERNADYSVTLILKDAAGDPVDLTDATVDAEIKQDYYFPTMMTFTVTKTNPAAGQVALSLTGIQTALLHPGPLKYDVLVKFQNGTFQKLLKGIITVDTNITTLS